MGHFLSPDRCAANQLTQRSGLGHGRCRDHRCQKLHSRVSTLLLGCPNFYFENIAFGWGYYDARKRGGCDLSYLFLITLKALDMQSLGKQDCISSSDVSSRNTVVNTPLELRNECLSDTCRFGDRHHDQISQKYLRNFTLLEHHRQNRTLR
jgi:hypothetical protein